MCDKDCINCQKEYCTDVYREGSRYCNRSESAKQYQKDYQKRKRDEAKAKGLCIVCRKRKATHGTKCLDCYVRQKRYDFAKYDGRRQRWKEEGKCYFCGAIPLPGKQVCPKHYDILCRNIEKANASEKTKETRRRQKDEMHILWSRGRYSSV